jgi:alkylation response protein AidB-like acyl-CoA dehydrogenase
VALAGAIVKDLGASFEQAIPEVARDVIAWRGDDTHTGVPRGDYDAVLAHSLLHAPASSIYGGTREILRGIIARGLGLR